MRYIIRPACGCCALNTGQNKLFHIFLHENVKRKMRQNMAIKVYLRLAPKSVECYIPGKSMFHIQKGKKNLKFVKFYNFYGYLHRFCTFFKSFGKNPRISSTGLETVCKPVLLAMKLVFWGE